jgi:hypothetical protein
VVSSDIHPPPTSTLVGGHCAVIVHVPVDMMMTVSVHVWPVARLML